MKSFTSLLVWALAATSSTSAFPLLETRDDPAPVCDCAGTKSDAQPGQSFICGDSRLGPTDLPKILPLGTYVTGYDRFGGLQPGQWLKRWTDKDGKFVYPTQNGFQLDANGNAINGTMILEKGTLVDRFGHEYGNFISAATAPYAQRALPPQNLNTDAKAPDYPNQYHVYRVIKPFTVIGGPIAPWFDQPGLGAQFFTGGVGNVITLINNGLLERVNSSTLNVKAGGCN